jgi:hypothetical protein
MRGKRKPQNISEESGNKQSKIDKKEWTEYVNVKKEENSETVRLILRRTRKMRTEARMDLLQPVLVTEKTTEIWQVQYNYKSLRDVLVTVLKKIMFRYLFLLNRLHVFVSSFTTSSVVINEIAQVLRSIFHMCNVCTMNEMYIHHFLCNVPNIAFIYVRLM